MIRVPWPRFSIGRLMAVIAGLALVLGIGRALSRAFPGVDGAWLLGTIGLGALAGPILLGLPYLVFFALPRLVLRLLLVVMPSLRADQDDPL